MAEALIAHAAAYEVASTVEKEEAINYGFGAILMIEEFEQAALTIDIPEFGLLTGDVGTIVDITSNGQQVTLEFFNFAGKTIAVVPVLIEQVRALGENEVLHTRAVLTM